MSIKLPKRLSSKKKKLPKVNAQADLLCNLGLQAFRTAPLDPASMLDISTWTLDNHVPVKLQDLPTAFLRRLWLLSPDARSPCISSPSVNMENGLTSTEVIMNGVGGEEQSAINSLDLVTAVFLSSNTFLHQDIVTRMLRCHFAVPLVLPNVDQEESSHFLLWPLRSAFSQWSCFSPDQNRYIVHEGDLASTPMPLVSCVRLGHCEISKSQVLNHLMSGTQLNEVFLHKGMAGGQQPYRLANGLVEIGWYLPSGDASTDIFPVPMVLANLRSDASAHKKNLTLLCQASSAVVIFCGNLKETEQQLLSFCKNTASKLIIIDVSNKEERENGVIKFTEENIEENIALPKESVLHGKDVEDLSIRLRDKLKNLAADPSTCVTLESAAQLASKLDLNVDEIPVCRKAMASAEQVLWDLEEGSAQYQEKQLPLQGFLWSKLSEIEKEESKRRKANKDIDLECQHKKKEIMVELGSYKITPAMKIFTDALFTNDKIERTYFLNWMKLKLSQIQAKKNSQGLSYNQTEIKNCIPGQATDECEDSDSFCTDSSIEGETIDESALTTEQQNQQDQTSGAFEDKTRKQLYPKPDHFVLGLQHFLREMGLIYELTHSINHNVLRLPSLAVDLLLYGVPLEIMDGDASTIPVQWLGSVLAELQRRLTPDQFRTRVMTTLGVQSANNAKLLSEIFNLKFADERKRCTSGIYMLGLCVPSDLQNDLKCDFLLLLDVEGLCSGNNERNCLTHDNEMATVATGLSDILIENISSHSTSKFENIFTVIVNALLRTRDYASLPICQIVSQDENINTILKALQLNRVSHILHKNDGVQNRPKPDTTTVIGPWYNESLSKPVHPLYGNSMMILKNKLINAIKDSSTISEASGLPQFMGRLCAVWDAVKADSFSVSLQNTGIALSFSMLCLELSRWENTLVEHMETWFMEAIKKIFASKARAVETIVQSDLLNQLMDEARAKVIAEVDYVTTKLEAYWMKDQYLKMFSETLKPVLTSNMEDLKERVTYETLHRLMTASENHCSSTQLRTFETMLKNEQETKLCELIENSKATNILQEDTQLEEEFESVWSKTVFNVDLRPSETEDISPRVRAVLRQNLINRGLHKHLKKLEKISQNQPEGFQLHDEHIVYQRRFKHMFEDNRKNVRLQAQQLACHIIDQYNDFVAEKSRLLLDFSDSCITELLENIETTLKEKQIEIRSGFEVDLKVYLCAVACKDFQKLQDNNAKDKKLLECINATKTVSLAEFIYQFRKRDQGQRVAQSFTCMVIRPIVQDYIYSPLGMQIVEEIQHKSTEYRSPLAFYRSLLEELINDEHIESYADFLFSYDTFKQKKIQETVLAHLSESDSINKWRQQRLGEIIGKIASAVSQTGEGKNAMLSDTKSLLEKVYLTLEKDMDIEISRDALDGPLFDITTQWDRFVTCLMESLAATRLELSQEFSQPVDGASLLELLPIQPQGDLNERLKGCEMCCPSCRAPCEVDDRGHEVHKMSLHRPKGLLPPEFSDMAFNTSIKTNSRGPSEVCTDIPSPDPLMNICCEGSHSTMPVTYWRYVLAKISERSTSEQRPIPEEWRKISQREALESLNEVFKTENN